MDEGLQAIALALENTLKVINQQTKNINELRKDVDKLNKAIKDYEMEKDDGK